MRTQAQVEGPLRSFMRMTSLGVRKPRLVPSDTYIYRERRKVSWHLFLMPGVCFGHTKRLSAHCGAFGALGSTVSGKQRK
jgi:hypothetical protein